MEDQIFWFDGQETANQCGITLRIKSDELSIGIVIGEVEELSCTLEAEQVARLCATMSNWLAARGQADLLQPVAGF
ncbi:hypothetical protein [Chromobacterium vaccinii]|uniref:hypothetical protein n=1 Tax=Chromobacterium vaccinii TaxID=1108595 RepID=UPI000E17E2EC|nr:hypothetical protein [Chromobacterium vaccinii]SUX54397.1 Uncharacterised protein [Chromobacterium vaccinii]